MPSTPQVVLITTSYPETADDPAGHFVAAEARQLVRQGNGVTVLCPGHASELGPPRVVRFADSGLFGWPGALSRLAQRPTRIVGAGRFVVGARWWLQSNPVDRIIAHWIVPSAWPIALTSRAPLEVVAHGSDVRLLTRAPHVARFIVRQLLRHGARFRFVSERLLDELVRVVGAQLEEVSRVEAAPIELPPTPPRDVARTRLGLGAERVILVVSRLVRGKRLGTALGAAQLVPNARVVVVGDGPLRPLLETRFPSVQWMGKLGRREALTWMAAADALLAVSLLEGAPTVIREARALGLPVIAAPSGDIAQWARDDPGIHLVASHPTPQDLD